MERRGATVELAGHAAGIMARQMMIVRGLVILLGCLLTGRALAQTPQHFPLDHRVEPGVISHWNSIAEPGLYGAPQPVLITLPEGGEVSFDPGGQAETARPTPAQATFLVGHVYRIRISGLPELPGVELYPTIELVDRLHPPAELADEFPVPIEITADEIESVLEDRMVTKVVYLERPDLASPDRDGDGPRVSDRPPSENLIETATNLGRPIAIVRMGGRIPLANSPDEWPSTPLPNQLPALPREQ